MIVAMVIFIRILRPTLIIFQNKVSSVYANSLNKYHSDSNTNDIKNSNSSYTTHNNHNNTSNNNSGSNNIAITIVRARP